MTLMGKLHVIDALFIPEVNQTLIIGINFWVTMDTVPDLRKDVWHFGSFDSSELCTGRTKFNLRAIACFKCHAR